MYFVPLVQYKERYFVLFVQYRKMYFVLLLLIFGVTHNNAATF